MYGWEFGLKAQKLIVEGNALALLLPFLSFNRAGGKDSGLT